MSGKNNVSTPSEKLRDILGERLKKAFKDSGMTQPELSAHCGIHQSYVSNIVRASGKTLSIGRLYDLLGLMSVIITVSIPE